MTSVALVGITGMVGQHIVSHLPAGLDLTGLASEKSHGKTVFYHTKPLTVQTLTAKALDRKDIVIFSTDTEISRRWVPYALRQNSFVIDASWAFRLDPKICLIVPPVNGHCITPSQQGYAQANCVASPLAVILHQLSPWKHRIHSVVISTYQSASGAGYQAVKDLMAEKTALGQSQNPLTHTTTSTSFPQGLAHRVIPFIGESDDQAFCTEEIKVQKELQRLLALPYPLHITTVRVPTIREHHFSLTLQWNDTPPSKTDIIHAFEHSPCRWETSFSDTLWNPDQGDIALSRLRHTDLATQLWCRSHNLYRGAATDIIEILKKILTFFPKY